MPRPRRRFTVHVFAYLTPEQAETLKGRAWARGIPLATLIRETLVDGQHLPCDPMPGPELPLERGGR